MQQSMRAFFDGVVTKRQRTHKIERRIPHTVFDTALHGGISGGSQTWCPFSESP
jgi:ribosome modulation factor